MLGRTLQCAFVVETNHGMFVFIFSALMCALSGIRERWEKALQRARAMGTNFSLFA